MSPCSNSNVTSKTINFLFSFNNESRYLNFNSLFFNTLIFKSSSKIVITEKFDTLVMNFDHYVYYDKIEK